jgi:hypothetical protein
VGPAAGAGGGLIPMSLSGRVQFPEAAALLRARGVGRVGCAADAHLGAVLVAKPPSGTVLVAKPLTARPWSWAGANYAPPRGVVPATPVRVLCGLGLNRAHPRPYGHQLRGLGDLVPQIQIGGVWRSVSEFIDQTLTMTTPATVYLLPDSTSPVVATVPAGQPAGTIYSYIQNGEGFWWQLTRDTGLPGYVLFQPAATVPPPAPPPPVPDWTFGGAPRPGVPSLTDRLGTFFGSLGTAGKWVIGGLAAVAVIQVARVIPHRSNPPRRRH